jgi:magnesium transporter
MKKKHIQKNRKKGMSPGTLVYTGGKPEVVPSVKTIWFTEQEIKERDFFYPEFLDRKDGVCWIDVKGLSSIKLIEEIGLKLQMHPLILEDILEMPQRPKLEEYDNGLFFLLTNLKHDPIDFSIITEQISVFMGKNVVVSFQEDPDDTFSSVRARLINNSGARIRKNGADYLTYALLDTIVDHFYIIQDEIEDKIITFDEHLLTRGSEAVSKNDLYNIKSALATFRRQIIPMRDVVMRFFRMDGPFIHDNNKLYFRDVADHITQIMDGVENSRDAIDNLQELHQAELGNRLNNVMRLLTVISTIFIPLSFIASMFGMNFDYMPGLHNYWGFYILAGLMLGVSIGMLFYFRRKRWI